MSLSAKSDKNPDDDVIWGDIVHIPYIQGVTRVEIRWFETAEGPKVVSAGAFYQKLSPQPGENAASGPDVSEKTTIIEDVGAARRQLLSANSWAPPVYVAHTEAEADLAREMFPDAKVVMVRRAE